jgi:hypothetical protein
MAASLLRAAALASAGAALALASASAPAPAAAPKGLYGLSAATGLIRIADNGTTTPVGPSLGAKYAQAQGLSTIDVPGQLFYSILYDLSTSKPMLVGLSLATGAVVSAVAVPFAEEGFIGVGQWLAFEGALVIVGGQNAAQAHQVGTIDPVKGGYKQIALLNASLLDVLGGCHAAYVKSSNEVLIQLGTQGPPAAINVYAIDVTSGAVRVSDMTETANIVTLSYDATTDVVVGLGIQVAGGKLQRTISSLDPKTLKVTTIGKTSAEVIESGGISAYNTDSKGLYWIGDKTGNDDFFLVQNSVEPGAKVLSTGDLCASDAACPWSLEYNGGA